MKIKIDLFSDSNVNPSIAMREAMMKAEVGNEVAAEDPTVNSLLEVVCELLDKPAATFMPSGSMCNSVGLRALCQPGDRIIIESTAHALTMTSGMISGLIGAQPEVIYGERGKFSASQLKNAIGNNSGYNIAKATVVSIEQTTNFGGGAIWSIDELADIHKCAKSNGLKLHLDGARLFNASVATGVTPAKYCSFFDSVWIDFAKGLGAPMGAVIAGEQSFIDKVWYYKFQQGGIMHQAGIIAAGCLYGLKHNVERLAGDHENARLLAHLLSKIEGIFIDQAMVETNIVIFSLQTENLSAPALVTNLLEKGIRLLALDDTRIRAITHMDIMNRDIHTVAEAIAAEVDEASRSLPVKCKFVNG